MKIIDWLWGLFSGDLEGDEMTDDGPTLLPWAEEHDQGERFVSRSFFGADAFEQAVRWAVQEKIAKKIKYYVHRLGDGEWEAVQKKYANFVWVE